MVEHSTEGVAFVDDPTGTLYARSSDMAQPIWCGICAGYGAHDTAHHDAQGGLVKGDMVWLKNDVPPDLQHLAEKRGRVEGVRGTTASVAIPGKAGTQTVTVDVKHLIPDV